MPEPLRETVVYALTRDDNVLLSHRLDPKSPYFDLDILPGGKVEPFDRLSSDYLATTLLREIKEEIDVTATNYRYLFSKSYPINVQTLLHFFIVTEWSGDIRDMEPHKEHFDWFSIAETLQNPTTIPLQDGLIAITNYLNSDKSTRQQLIRS